jgi:hypothetical protein
MCGWAKSLRNLPLPQAHRPNTRPDPRVRARAKCAQRRSVAERLVGIEGQRPECVSVIPVFDVVT